MDKIDLMDKIDKLLFEKEIYEKNIISISFIINHIY